MHISKNIIRRVSRPLVHGLLAGVAILVIASCGLFYLWSSAREAQLDAVRNELGQLARVAATLVDGDLHKTLVSDAQAGSAEHLSLLAPLVRFQHSHHCANGSCDERSGRTMHGRRNGCASDEADRSRTASGLPRSFP
jgi:hypothetical protein